jgi:glutamyl-tRNA synthetase
MPVRVRYAPSPTGSPHVGGLRTYIFNWLLRQREGGQFLARLEDTDRTPGRYVPESTYELEESFLYVGCVPDEAWFRGGEYGPYVQSQRLPIYQEVAEDLIAEGHAYRCYCTKERLEKMRQEQQDRGAATGYDRHCRTPERRERMRQTRIAQEGVAEPSSVVRLAMPLEGATVLHDVIRGEISFENRLQDDQVLLKSDGFPTYFLAAPVDDHLMKITHILRGEEWLSSAPKVLHLFHVLSWEAPKMAHLPVIVGTDRKKLSKRHGATQVKAFMEQGYLPEALINFLVLLGWSAGDENRELFTIPELIERFSLEGIAESPAVFDYDKLKWMNGHYIRQSEPGRIIGMCLPHLRKAGLIPPEPTPQEGENDKIFEARKEQYRIEWLDYARRVIPLELERMKVISEIVELVGFFFEKLDYPVGYDPKATAKWFGVAHLKPLLQKVINGFTALAAWNAADIESVVRQAGEDLNVKFADVIHPIRVAATGRTIGPGLFETLEALGRDRVLERLRTVLERV